MEKSTHELISGSAATLLGTAVSAVLSVVYISVGARWLGPAQYAHVAVAVSTANLVAVAFNPVEAGLTLRMAGLAGRGEHAALRHFVLRCLSSVVWLAAPLLAVWAAVALFGDAPVDGVMLASFACGSLVANVPRAALRGRESFVALAVNWVLESGVRLGAGLALVALGAGGSGMIAGYALGSLVALGHGAVRSLAGLPVAEGAPGSGRSDLFLPFRSLSAPLLGLHAYTAVVVNADMLVAGHYLSGVEAGEYGGAASIARIVLVGGHPLLLVLFSRLAALSAAGSDTRGTLRLGALVVLGGLGGSMLIPALAGRFLLRGFLGQAYQGGADVLIWQWATACLLIAQGFVAESMVATSRVRGGWLCLVPAAALVGCLGQFHGTGLEIARTTCLVCATAGSLTFALLWRWRLPLEIG